MAGRKGQRSGGHNKKSAEDHVADGTFQPCRHENASQSAGGFDRALSVVGTDAAGEMQRLYGIYRKSATAWDNDPTDKEARLSATAALDRFLRIAGEVAREEPPEETSDTKSDGAVTMQDLLDERG